VQDLDKIFVAKNKRALLEEMAMQLSKAHELIDIASTSPDGVAGAFVGLAACMGMIDGFFKEYMLLRKGEIAPTTAAIGFHAFDEDEDEGFDVEDTTDSEAPEARPPRKNNRKN